MLTVIQVHRVFPKPFHQCKHQRNDDQEEGRRCNNRDRLQVVQRVRSTGNQQHNTDCGGEHTPQARDANVGNDTAILGHRAHHRRRRIGGGNEEGSQQNHRQDGEDLSPRHGLEQREQLVGGVTVAPNGAASFLQVNSRPTEDRKPHHRNCRRNQQHHAHELADGASAGNASNEHSDEG